MSDFDDRNTGCLFKNEQKEGKQPDYSGPFTGPNGEELQIAAWLKKSKAGKTYMFVKTSEPFEPKQGQVATPAPAPEGDFDDDIPF